MPSILEGDRVARGAPLRLSVVAAIFDSSGRILLTRRKDDGHWCLPAGAMDSGESASEACEREVLEETHLKVRVTKLLGVYSSPNYLCVYEDGNRWHVVDMFFDVEVIGGALALSEETTDARFFTLEETYPLNLHSPDKQRLEDAFTPIATVLLR
jgi:ADP-ribose pyrophosphatase YjhB (NUDIX family)